MAVTKAPSLLERSTIGEIPKTELSGKNYKKVSVDPLLFFTLLKPVNMHDAPQNKGDTINDVPDDGFSHPGGCCTIS